MINNTSRRAAANATYMFGIVKEGSKVVPLMMTTAEYSKAMARAGKNPEDCIRRYSLERPRRRGFMAWLKGK